MRAGFVWDDDDYVTENATLRSGVGLARIWLELGAVPQYYPLVHTTFWIEYRLWGLRPLGFHVTNILLHALNGLLLWELLRRLRVPGAWLGAALFVLHPMQVESVAWVTERKNVLSGAFYLLAALTYLGSRQRPDDASPSPPGAVRYGCAIVLYAAALLSKSVTATLPAAIAVVLGWRDGRIDRRHVARLAAMLPMGAAAGALTSWMEKNDVGASGPDWAFSLLDRSVIAGRAFWFYLGKLIWPHPLIFIYPRWKIVGAPAEMILFPAAALALVVALWLARGRIGRGPLAAVLLFAGTLAPALGFVNVYPMRFSFVADHFAYLAVIGPLALFAAGVAALVRAPAVAPRRFGWSLGAMAVVAAATVTFQRGYAYADEETLWRDTLRRNPDAFIASNNLGGMLLRRGELAPATELFERALRTKPDFPEGLDNLGLVKQREGKLDEAISCFRSALRWDPNFVNAHNNLGIALAQQGRSADALQQFSEAIRAKPSFAKAHLNLGLALEASGRSGEAAGAYRDTLRLSPGAADVEKRLAWILATDPDPRVRNGTEALRLAELANAAGGGRDAQAMDVLAAAYAESGRFDEAVRAAARALELSGSTVSPEARRGAEQRLALYRAGRPFRVGVE